MIKEIDIMAKIIDRRGESMGGNDKRAVSRITNIAIHYSATSSGNTSAFENYWKNTHKWNTGGYHEVVILNGDVELNYNADTISNGVGGQNTRMYNICYVGDGKPNTAQLKTLRERVNYNRNRFGLPTSAVKGHREYQGQSTNCPALDMGAFRKSLTNTPTSTNKATSKPKKVASKSGKGDIKTKSIVVYLQSIGQPYSFAHRAKLAKQYGIKNYKGTSIQNLMLLDYLRKGKATKAQTSSFRGKRVESKVNGLRFYNKLSWSDKDVVGTVNKGYGFPTIVSKHKVGKGYQYKVKNSKSKVYYITAASKYVRVG